MCVIDFVCDADNLFSNYQDQETQEYLIPLVTGSTLCG